MPFTNPIVAGTTLVRPAIRSPNYVTGVSGWTINVDGSAEFNNITVRGVVDIGGAPNGEIKSNIVTNAGFTHAEWSFYTHIPQETAPGQIYAQGNPTTGQAQTLVTSPASSSGVNDHTVLTLASGGTDTSGIPYASLLFPGVAGAASSGNFVVGIGPTQGISIDGSMNSAAGPLNGLMNGIQAMQLGPSYIPLLLNAKGGQVTIPQTGTGWANAPLMIGGQAGNGLAVQAQGIDAGNNGALNQPLFLNNNSTQGIRSFNMSGTAVGGLNVAMSTTSSTYNAPANTPSFTFTYPPSGAVLVWISGGLGISVATAASFAIVSFEIRDTNATGTIRSAASDNLSTSINGATHGANTSGVSPAGAAIVIAGLPTSGTGFIRLMIRSSDNAATAVLNRPIVTLLPSL